MQAKFTPGRHLVLLLLTGGLFLAACASKPTTAATASPWQALEGVLANIQPPTFPDRTFNVTDFGAVASTLTNSQPAFNQAIDQCSAAGGGRVEVRPGTYRLDGPIVLKSNVNLHLPEGVELRFSVDPAHYLPVVRTRWEGVDLMNYSPLVYAYQQENIAITGPGILDGQADTTNWWPWSGSREYGWREGKPTQADSMSRQRLYNMNYDEVPVEERIFGKGTYLRPNFIQPYDCKNVLIQGVTFKNSPMWVIHPVLSENVTIQDVRVISHGPNSDGCDPESCRNVLIRNCYFDTGDDCIALKSGRNEDGRRIGRPIENVVIQGCRMKDGHGGVVIGSEVSGGARNIFAEDCQMDSPNLDRAIRVKTNKTRGGKIENLFVRNIMVGEVKEAVVRINMLYRIYEDKARDVIPVVENIHIENVRSSKSEYGIMIDGYDEEHPVRNVVIENCRFDGVSKGNKIKHVEGLVLEDFYLNGAEVQ